MKSTLNVKGWKRTWNLLNNSSGFCSAYLLHNGLTTCSWVASRNAQQTCYLSYSDHTRNQVSYPRAGNLDKSGIGRTCTRCKVLGWLWGRGERLIKLGYSWFSAKSIKVGPPNPRLTKVKSQGWLPGAGNCLPVLSYLWMLLSFCLWVSQSYGAKVVRSKEK